MISNRKQILQDIQRHLKKEKGFSIVRLGDGDLKLIRSLFRKEYSAKLKQQGIPNDPKVFKKILEMYSVAMNAANYISSFDVYFHENSPFYWPRNWNNKIKVVKKWKKVYEKLNVHNDSYCNPDISFFLFLESEEGSLFDLLRDRKICLVTPFEQAKPLLEKFGFDVDLVLVPPRNGNHYTHFNLIMEKIKRKKDCNVFLVGAGALGRAYSHLVKQMGKVAIDIGQVFDIWVSKKRMVPRLQTLLKMNSNLTFSLTKKGKEFQGAI